MYPKRVLIFLEYHFASRVYCSPFNKYPKTIGEQLTLKPMESTVVYFLTTNKAIITKFDPNIKQLKF